MGVSKCEVGVSNCEMWFSNVKWVLISVMGF